MNIENGRISGLQFSSLIIGFIEGSIILTSFASNITKQETWLAILTGLLSIAPFIYFYTLLAKRFPGINFAQINRLIYGPYIGIFITVLYLCYFILTLSFNIQDLGNFYTVFFMRNTPIEVFLIIFTLTCAYVVWHGIEVLARVSQIIVPIVLLVVLAATFLLFPQMNFSNLLPLFDLPIKDYIHGTQIIAAIPFGELVAILTITFALNNTSHISRNTLVSLFLGALLLVIITIRNTAVLGNTEAFLISPSYQVVRLINIGFLSRMDILFALIHTFALFLKCSILLYGIILLLSQLLKLKTYTPVIFPISCILIILAIIVYPSIAEHIKTSQKAGIMFGFPFIYIIPSLSLLIAKIRNLRKKGTQ